jgi:hypothetical protein
MTNSLASANCSASCRLPNEELSTLTMVSVLQPASWQNQ